MTKPKSAAIRAKENVKSPETTTSGIKFWSGNTQNGIQWDVRKGSVEDTLRDCKDESYHCIVTSPPYYWQRDYETKGQIGLEPTIAEYTKSVCSAMNSVRRVMRKDATLFLNLGDTYYSAKGQPKGKDRKNKARRFGLRAVDASGLGVARKTAIGIPWRVAIAMIDEGWTLRSPIIWYREKAIPEPTAKDRPWRKYETVFMFSKGPKYFFDRAHLNNEEDIWFIPNRAKGSNGLHAAAFPDELVERCLSAGCPAGGRVLDPFAGSGTTLRVAVESDRPASGIDINGKYCSYMTEMLSKL
jgi:site-specific DNA-methyltransferase (adenine-specific)